ncbi:MAG: sigma-70 family RNA polymerase sigma factor [Anaerolineae bacterium]|nr:sigma-70 family RNA polymerase sigma factor [Anaerolineae bacterium]
MPDKTRPVGRSEPETNTPAFTFYMADLQRLEEIMPEPDLRQDLAASQLRYVVRVAQRIARRYPGVDLDFLDMIQEGNLALLQAVNEWLDCPPRAAHFHTFIARRVERAIRQCADGAWRESARSCSLEEHWDELCQLEAPRELEPEESLSYREGQETMMAVLSSLDRRRREVVTWRCGFSDGQQKTYEEIGQAFGVSRTRVRQLMASAERILRYPIRSRRLRDAWPSLI